MNIKHAAAAALFVTFTGALGLVVEACSDESGTTGKRVVLRTRVVGEQAARSTFTNGLGWSVTLTTAYLSTGPLYYFDGDPILARFRGSLLPRVAHAHPGHYAPGTARGEMTVASSVDLLSSGNGLPAGVGVTGSYRSARFTFGSASALAGHVVLVHGEARHGATTVSFTAHADVADVLDTFNEPKVDGCVFAPVDVAGDGTVTLTVRPTVWFDQVDFTGVSGDLAGTVAFNGFARGLKKGSAYAFAYTP